MSVRIMLLAAAILVGGRAVAANVEELTKQLSGEAALVARTPGELEGAYSEVLPSLLKKPETDDVALQKIVNRASRPGAETERAALSKVLAARLSGDAATPVKVVLLRHLQRIGRDEAVGAVAARLGDGDALVRESARRALAGIPTKSAAEVLRGEIGKAGDAKWKGALVVALSHRRDPADVNLYANLVKEEDDAVRVPALLALARTGDASAARILSAARTSGSELAKKTASDAYLLLADRLAEGEAGWKVAAGIYREFWFAPQPYRGAAILGLARVGTKDDLMKTVAALSDKEPSVRGAALEALSRNREAAVANEIVARLAKSEGADKTWLLRALLDQGDKRVKSFLVDAAGDTDDTVRMAGLQGLARVGDGSAVAVLLKSALAKGEEQIAARWALDTLAGKDVDAALLERVAGGEAAQRTEVIRTLGARQTKEAVGPLFEAVKDEDSGVRSEAFKSVGMVADFETLPRALGLVVNASDDAVRDQAAKAVVAIARKNDNVDQRSEAILAAAEKAEGPTKGTLLNVLGQLGGGKALAALKGAIASEDAKTHEAGVRALANWPDAGPAKDLLAIARDEKNNTLSVLALRGYVRMVGLPSQRKAPETVKMLAEAMMLAKRNEEKRMVLGAFGEVKDLKSLEVVAPFLEVEGLQGEACAAAVKISRDAVNGAKEFGLIRETMEKVMEVSKVEGQKKGAKEVLEKVVGREKELAKEKEKKAG